jgi:hypothetical protein
MSAQIEIGTYDGIRQGDETGGCLSANVVGSSDPCVTEDLVEIRLSVNGTTNSLRLTRTETDVFSLMLARLADDAGEAADLEPAGEAFAERLTREGRSITRDELIRMLLELPRRSEIDIQIGTEHVGIAGVMPWGRSNWAALQCLRPDFLDLLEAWCLPADIHEQIVNGTR